MVGYEWMGATAMNARVSEAPVDAVAVTQQSTTLVSRLGLFIQLEQGVREADSLQSLGLVACNQIKSLLSFQTCVWASYNNNTRQRVFSVARASSSMPTLVLVSMRD